MEIKPTFGEWKTVHTIAAFKELIGGRPRCCFSPHYFFSFTRCGDHLRLFYICSFTRYLVFEESIISNRVAWDLHTWAWCRALLALLLAAVSDPLFTVYDAKYGGEPNEYRASMIVGYLFVSVGASLVRVDCGEEATLDPTSHWHR